jgi:hypothetical protein
MKDMAELSGAVKALLEANQFDVATDINLEGSRFDLVAEDSTRLVFVVCRDDNTAWLDDFREHQASLAETLSQVDLGRKWRDVYLIEVTGDPIDTDAEARVTESIRANTEVARKLVVDASSVEPSDPGSVYGLLRAILPPRKLTSSVAELDVMDSLRDRLVTKGFSSHLVTGLISGFMDDRGELWKLALDEGKWG